MPIWVSRRVLPQNEGTGHKCFKLKNGSILGMLRRPLLLDVRKCEIDQKLGLF